VTVFGRPKPRGPAGPPAAIRRWLLTGEAPARGEPGYEEYVADYFFNGLSTGGPSLWRHHGEALLEEWIREHPGTRPNAWPLPPGPGGVWCAERRKVGGSGAPSAAWYQHEALHALCDCDPSDPPHIESMATFLKRLGVLLPGEEKRIPKRAWAPEALDVDPEGWAPAGAGGWAA
jgi:hypothetical protein